MAVDETLAWTRPNFFALRFELASSTGIVARVGINGIGPDRHALAETEAGTWRFDLFPLSRVDVPITPLDGGDPVAVYSRANPVEVRFLDGETFHFRAENPLKTFLEDSSGRVVFSVEMVEAFPRWRAEIKLESDPLDTAKLAILLASSCCYLVFNSTHRDVAGLAEKSSVQGG